MNNDIERQPRLVSIFHEIEEQLDSDSVLKTYLAQVEYLKNNNRITDEQNETFITMLKSEDLDNRTLACMIIDNFDKDEYSI